MCVLFLISLLGTVAVLPLHFWSLEHGKLEERYGEQRGKRIGAALGIISGWGYFIFLFGLWVSPQTRFTIPFYENLGFKIPLTNHFVPIFSALISLPFILPAIWFGVKGVRELGLETSETHRAHAIATSGVYSVVRHPQYLGGMLAHVGFSILLSGLYSLLISPVIMTRDFAACRKEETELIREFGSEYEGYKKKVPMLLPRLHAGE
jgi:protein-S-isoprenylcysteine O-methyltransferase Ste14